MYMTDVCISLNNELAMLTTQKYQQYEVYYYDYLTLVCVSTFYEKGLLVIDIHQTVGTSISVASKGVPDQLLPGGLRDSDIIVLHPAALMWVIDVCPVVACIGLAFMDQHCMKPVWNLEQQKDLISE